MTSNIPLYGYLFVNGYFVRIMEESDEDKNKVCTEPYRQDACGQLKNRTV